MAISTKQIEEILEVMRKGGAGSFRLNADGLMLEVSFAPELTPLPAEDVSDPEPSEDDLKFWSAG